MRRGGTTAWNRSLFCHVTSLSRYARVQHDLEILSETNWLKNFKKWNKHRIYARPFFHSGREFQWFIKGMNKSMFLMYKPTRMNKIIHNFLLSQYLSQQTKVFFLFDTNSKCYVHAPGEDPSVFGISVSTHALRHKNILTSVIKGVCIRVWTLKPFCAVKENYRETFNCLIDHQTCRIVHALLVCHQCWFEMHLHFKLHATFL